MEYNYRQRLLNEFRLLQSRQNAILLRKEENWQAESQKAQKEINRVLRALYQNKPE